MLGITDRFRRRDSPIPPGGRIKAGERHVMSTSTGESLGHADIWSASSSYPAERESTWDEIHPGPPYKTGGDFANIKIQFPQFQVQGAGSYWTDVISGGGAFRNKYIGGFCDPLWIPALDSLNESDYYTLLINTVNPTLLPDLAALGAAAYNRLRPHPEKANVGLTLAEMKELPRMLKDSSKEFSNVWKALGGDLKHIRMSPKKASNLFLLHQFGWKPFLKDMSQIIDAYDNSQKYMAQIKKDNGQWTRRYRADKIVESEELLYSRTDIAGCYPDGSGELYGITQPPYLFTIKLQHYVQVWYEGVFKYYRPAFDDTTELGKSPMGAVHRNLLLYGAYVSPSVMYQATPWSWCIDWFTNLGSLIQQAEDWATDAVVSKYMYLMHHHRRRYELRSQFMTADGKKDLVWYTHSCESKRRQGGSTAFQFNPVPLSARQIAILAALGISRS